jgi:hypothetical protein
VGGLLMLTFKDGQARCRTEAVAEEGEDGCAKRSLAILAGESPD